MCCGPVWLPMIRSPGMQSGCRPIAPTRRPRLPDGQHRPGRTAARWAVRDPRLQDELARRPRRSADLMALPARGATQRDGARTLRPTGTFVPRRAPPLPSVATTRLRPRARPRRRLLPVHPRHGRRRHADHDDERCGVFSWHPPRAPRGAERCARRRRPGCERLRRAFRRGVRSIARARRARAAARVQCRWRPVGRRRARRARCSPSSSGGASGEVQLAMRSPSARHGSAAYSSIWRRCSDTATVESDEPVDLSALPWPTSANGPCGVIGAAPDRGRRGARRRTAPAPARRARGCTSTATGARSARSRATFGRSTPLSAASRCRSSPTGSPACSPSPETCSSSAPPPPRSCGAERDRRRPGDGQDDDGRAGRGAAVRTGAVAGGPRRSWR